MPELKHWESFYVIVGAAAGALIGLQFVVMTLIAERPDKYAAAAGGALGGAFATPTIVHFSVAFFLAALVTAPWQAVTTVAVAWGLTGLIGAMYVAIVARRMRAQKAYRPELEDWLFHVLLPLVPMRRLRFLHSPLPRTSTRRSSASARQSCCWSSSASTTRGTPSPTW